MKTIENEAKTLQAIEAPRPNEIAEAVYFFRMLTNEEQRIAFAVLEGMKLQKNISAQGRLNAE